MKDLKVATVWDTNGSTAAAKIILTQEGMVDNFKSNKVTSKEIQKHCNMVWDNLAFGVDTSIFLIPRRQTRQPLTVNVTRGNSST